MLGKLFIVVLYTLANVSTDTFISEGLGFTDEDVHRDTEASETIVTIG